MDSNHKPPYFNSPLVAEIKRLTEYRKTLPTLKTKCPVTAKIKDLQELRYKELEDMNKSRIDKLIAEA